MTATPADRRSMWVALGLAAVTLAVYAQTGTFDFVLYDDQVVVSENPYVQRGINRETLLWALTAIYVGTWQPLTWLSHMLDVQLFGLAAGGHHLTSAVLHAANTGLLFVVLRALSGPGGHWPSAIVAALFGLHPLHIESVAWIAERKDVLSTVFWIGTMAAYLAYVRRPGWGRYLLLNLCFAVGLTAKPMLVTLPILLLFLDVWPLGRLRVESLADLWPARDAILRLLREKIPLYGMTVASCVITLVGEARHGTIGDLVEYPIDMRLKNAAISYVTYLVKTAWPDRILIFYPYPASIPLWKAAGAALILAGITHACLRGPALAKRPYLAVGWLWYLVSFVPVIELVQSGNFAMAERYTYVPLIGIFIMLAWGGADLARGLRLKTMTVAVVAGGVIAALGLATFVHLRHWRNSETLFTNAVRVDPDNAMAHVYVGTLRAKAGRFDEALAHFNQAIAVDPKYFHAYRNLGLALEIMGRTGEAEVQYRKALEAKPGFVAALNSLGVLLLQQGRTVEAVTYLDEALRRAPDLSGVRMNLGAALFLQGRLPEAADQFSEILAMDPDSLAARNGMGRVLLAMGRNDDAAREFEAVLARSSEQPLALNGLGEARLAQGRAVEAERLFQQALGLAPDFPEARVNLERLRGGR